MVFQLSATGMRRYCIKMTLLLIKRGAFVLSCILIAMMVLTGCAGTPDGLDPVRSAEPLPSLSARDVVEIQLRAFGNNDSTDEGIQIAFRFASPQNRAQTGPVERFSAMMRGPAYEVMLDHDRAEFAPLVMRGDVAVQRVALYRGDEVVIFDFFLRRQTAEPYVDCWMTEGVFFRGAGASTDGVRTL